MAKYYLQSGSARMVLDSEDSERACLWFMHRVLQSIGPVYEDDTLDANRKLDVAIVESLIDLDAVVEVSEQGFDRADAEKFETLDLVLYWHQLMIALSKLS